MALNKSFFYHNMVRKYVVGFGDLFTNIQVQREAGPDGVKDLNNEAQTLRHRERVPLTYAAKEKFEQRLIQDGNLDSKPAVKMPRMAFDISGFTYDPSRKLSSKRTYKYVTGVTSRSYHYNPVPYDIGFNLYIAAKTQDEGLQIIEQIIPFFTPDYTIALKLIDVPEADSFDIPITLDSVTVDDSYDGSFTERRIIIWTLAFTAKAFFIGQVRTQGLIEHVIANVIQGECHEEDDHSEEHGEEEMDLACKRLAQINARITINHFGEDNYNPEDESTVLPSGTLYIVQGTTFNYVLIVENEDGSPFNLAGWTAKSQMRANYASDKFYEFTATIINEPGGRIQLSMTPTETALISSGYYIFDVEIENEDGYVINVADGSVYVQPQVTR